LASREPLSTAEFPDHRKAVAGQQVADIREMVVGHLAAVVGYPEEAVAWEALLVYLWQKVVVAARLRD
jgi:hypothetical protein